MYYKFILRCWYFMWAFSFNVLAQASNKSDHQKSIAYPIWIDLATWQSSQDKIRMKLTFIATTFWFSSETSSVVYKENKNQIYCSYIKQNSLIVELLIAFIFCLKLWVGNLQFQDQSNKINCQALKKQKNAHWHRLYRCINKSCDDQVLKDRHLNLFIKVRIYQIGCVLSK